SEATCNGTNVFVFTVGRNVIEESYVCCMGHVKAGHAAIGSSSSKYIQQVRSTAGASGCYKYLAVYVIDRFRPCVREPEKQVVLEPAFNPSLKRVIDRVSRICSRLNRT